MIDVDTIPLNFGKYEGKTPEEIAEIDEGYIVWMYDNVTPKYCTKELRDYCEMDIREQEDIINENRYDIY
jgi:uncharacterized protein (DUF3820 family)